jgi:NADH dehydrogenase
VPGERFEYTDRGTMATIGRHAAVAEFPSGFRARGFLAWLMWLGLHLVQLIGFRNRLNVLVNWAWNYVTWDRSARLILDVVPEPEPGTAPASEPTRAQASGRRRA